MAIFTNLFQYWSSSIYNTPQIPEVEMTLAVRAHFSALEELSSSPDQIGTVYASVPVKPYLNELVEFLVKHGMEVPLQLSTHAMVDRNEAIVKSLTSK